MVWDGSKWQKALAESAANPNLRVGVYDGTYKATVDAATSDGIIPAAVGLVTVNKNILFNGSTWDRWRNNTEKTVLPSAARTVSGASPDQTNFNARGVIIYLNVTAVSGTFAAGEGLSMHVDFKDPVSGEYPQVTPDIGPYTTTGLRCIVVYPGATDVRGYFPTENDVPLPRTWRVHYGITGTAPSFTFSVGASYVV